MRGEVEGKGEVRGEERRGRVVGSWNSPPFPAAVRAPAWPVAARELLKLSDQRAFKTFKKLDMPGAFPSTLPPCASSLTPLGDGVKRKEKGAGRRGLRGCTEPRVGVEWWAGWRGDAKNENGKEGDE